MENSGVDTEVKKTISIIDIGIFVIVIFDKSLPEDMSISSTTRRGVDQTFKQLRQLQSRPECTLRRSRKEI